MFKKPSFPQTPVVPMQAAHTHTHIHNNPPMPSSRGVRRRRKWLKKKQKTRDAHVLPSKFSLSLMCWRLQPVSSRLSSGSGPQGSSREWLFRRCLGLDATQQDVVFPMTPTGCRQRYNPPTPQKNLAPCSAQQPPFPPPGPARTEGERGKKMGR